MIPVHRALTQFGLYEPPPRDGESEPEPDPGQSVQSDRPKRKEAEPVQWL